MAWWSKAVSAVKSAVNKVASVVKSVASSVSKSVSKAVSSVKTAVSKVVSSVSRSVSNAVSSAKTAVSKVTNTIKTNVSEKVEKVKDKVIDIKSGIENAVRNAIDAIDDKITDVKEVVKEVISEKIKEIAVIQIGPFKKVDVSLIQAAYFFATGKTITKLEILRWEAKALDWIAPMNALSVLLSGKNLDGEPERFGTTMHYIDLALGLVMFIPITKIPGIGAKIAGKAGSKGLFKTAEKMALKKATPAQLEALLKTGNFKWLLEAMRIDPKAWAKLAPKFSKQAQALISAALEKQHPKTAFRLFEKALVNNANKIKINLGIPITLPAVKTIAFGLGGIMGVLGMAYGIPFGTSWFAKEGLDEILRFPLRDRIKDYKFNPTPEKLESIRKSLAQFGKSVPVAEALVKSVSWLWPFTKTGWDFYIENLNFELEEMKGEVGLLAVVEELPEDIEAVVRDIIDGDTIDVDLKAINKITNEEINMPEYGTTGHARVRIVGINAPEKSPKGEIVCTGIEIFSVEKEYTDQSRDALLPLNDKKVILKLDLENRADTYGRILAVIDYQGQDIGLRQIEDGLACYYFREPHDKVDDVLYEEATKTAKADGVGMWKGLEDVEKEEDKIKIRITSKPTNAKLFLDDVSLRHNTPSDQEELSDVIHLFTLGNHVLSAEKAGLSAMVDIEIVKGDNGTINLDLETEPIEEEPTEEEIEAEELEEEIEEEEVEEEKIEEEVIEEITEPVKVSEIPKPYTSEQGWALNEAFAKILALTEGKEIMSEKERVDLINTFAMYTDGQKEILNLLWRDLTFYTQGKDQLSADEYIALKEKYQGI